VNPVLARLHEERAQQVAFIDQTLDRVNAEGRDLVDAELANLSAARDRIAQIDAQRAPLEAFESLREVSAESARLAFRQPTAAAEQRGVTASPRPQEYATAGDFIVDYIRAVGYRGGNVDPDPEARQRVSAALGRDVAEVRAVQNNTTADAPGLLPKPIVGQIITDLDGSRPFVSSIGAQPLTQPGKTFSRPVITQHTDVAEQAQEKTELASRKLIVGEVDFTKRTFGGVVDVARQLIDWSSPSAWNAIITDLQNIYGADTEDAASQAFAASVLAAVPVADDSLDALVDALYQAAAQIVVDPTMGGRASALRLPDTIWTSVDQWALIGAALSKARLTLLQSPGDASVTSVNGDLLNIPRIMCPGFPADTVIIGRKNRTEFYEERIGVLSAVEPRLLGVEVAYGGYAAFGTLDPTSFAKLIPPAGGAAAEADAGTAKAKAK
jgi:HK97 family phage major capsid protein